MVSLYKHYDLFFCFIEYQAESRTNGTAFNITNYQKQIHELFRDQTDLLEVRFTSFHSLFLIPHPKIKKKRKNQKKKKIDFFEEKMKQYLTK